jgi:VWFA-related protein
MLKPIAALLASVAFSAALLVAQTEPFVERIDVDVVEVDVVVTDRAGNRVTDLARDEFELLVDGKLTAIEYFAAPAGSRVQGPDQPPPPAELVVPTQRQTRSDRVPWRLFFFVDQNTLEGRAKHEALREVRDLIRRRSAEAPVVTIAAFEESLRLFGAPTADPVSLESRLKELEKMPSHAGLGRAERRQLEREIREVGQGSPLSSGSAESGRTPIQVREANRLEHEIPLWAEQEIDRQRRAIAALGQFVTSLASLDGRKEVVLVTGGFDSRPAEFLLDLLAQQRGQRPVPDPRLAALGLDVAREFEQVVGAAQDARVAFYTVAPAAVPTLQNSAEFGGTGPDSYLPVPVDRSVVDQSSSIARLAGATGGRTFIVGDDLERRLDAMQKDADALYSLGFSVSADVGPGDHRIEVRTRRSDLRARHRESFQWKSLGQRSQQALLAAATLGVSANPWSVEVECGLPVPAPGGKGYIVPLVVRVPLQHVSLLQQAGANRGKVWLRVAILDPGGKLRVGGDSPLAIALDSAVEPNAIWTHRAEMRLAAGVQRVAVLLVDPLTGAYSVAVKEFDPAGITSGNRGSDSKPR